MPRRREYLRTATSIATVGLLAGCRALQGDGETDGTQSTTESGPGPATATETDGPSVAALEQRSREFLETIDAGEFEAAHSRFAESSQSAIGPADLSQAWAHVEGARGQYVGVAGVEHTTDGDTDVLDVTVEFSRADRRVRFAYRDGELTGFRFPSPEIAEWTPPDYADELAFTAEEREVRATDECTLGATLTIPVGDRPVPGVVLVHGNGPNDRDETVGPNMPFRDLAWGLASRGVAVLRYDKRTEACGVDLASATIDDVVTDDAVAALDVLRAEDRVREDAVFVAGHSIGATLAPRIAARDGAVAGAIMLAPLGRSVPDAMIEQNEHVLSLDGTLSEREQRQLEQVGDTAERIRTLDVGEDEVVYLGGREYWRTMTEYDRFDAARGLGEPLYLVFGGQDWQVTVENDRRLWRDALADEPDVTVRTYGALNHLLMPSQGAATQWEYLVPGHVSETLVSDVANWIQDVAGEGD